MHTDIIVAAVVPVPVPVVSVAIIVAIILHCRTVGMPMATKT